MTLDTFFKKFDEFASAPNAVQKMRELILELAVRGKLLQTNDVDWSVKELKSITTKIGSGATPSGGKINYKMEGIPLIRSMNVYYESFNRDGLVYLDIEQAKKLDNVIVHTNDVLLNITGASIGRVSIAPSDMNGARVNQHVSIIRPTDEVAPRFIALFLASPSMQKVIMDIQVGATREALTKAMIELFAIPLPPLAEQKRIVAKVDELMALCDRLEAQEAERREKGRNLLRAAIARFAEKPTAGNLGLVFHKAFDVEPAEIRKVILELAVRGKLVEQRSFEDKASTIFSQGSNPLFRPDAYAVEQRFEVPPSWIWIKFAAVGEQRLGKMLDQKGNRGDPRPYLRNTNVQWMRFDLDDIKDLRLEEDELEEYRLRDGDLLICEGGEPGRCAIWKNQHREMYFQKAIHRIRPRNGILPEYLAINLRVEAANGVLEQYFTGATIKHLTGRSLADYSLPLPPAVEQKRIIAKVDELMVLVDRLENALAESRALSERLLDAAISEVIANAQWHTTRAGPERSGAVDEELREALLISRIVQLAADPKHPLGRFRRTKFSYLAHRRAGDDVTKHYIKKAAGPYSPWAKFDGPEDLARARGYVRDAKADPFEGMVSGESAGEIEGYAADPLVGGAVDWVMENFRFETNDNLELLTTVDFAVVGLRNEGAEISREEIKKVIAKNKEWAAKLKRGLFSDENIDKALKRLAGVFPEIYGK